ncbi:MAG: carboxymuconolactone decarboxylase family protein [Treponemataceae bacterium]|nr:carboxymuconolactone decarboxylase family protein [Treponemataceae bacterium]
MKKIVCALLAVACAALVAAKPKEKKMIDEKLDPEFAAIAANMTETEAPGYAPLLDGRARAIAVTATLLGTGGADAFEARLPQILEQISAGDVKEIIYQAAAYLGIPRVTPFLDRANKIALPLESRSTTTAETRFEAGVEKQVELFGSQMRSVAHESPVREMLADNCFGDYYTRTGFTNAERELMTFCYLAAFGGVEPQLTAHAAANIVCGNSKEFLLQTLYLCVPYNGYPRTLNAITCVENAAK